MSWVADLLAELTVRGFVYWEEVPWDVLEELNVYNQAPASGLILGDNWSRTLACEIRSAQGAGGLPPQVPNNIPQQVPGGFPPQTSSSPPSLGPSFSVGRITVTHEQKRPGHEKFSSFGYGLQMEATVEATGMVELIEVATELKRKAEDFVETCLRRQGL